MAIGCGAKLSKYFLFAFNIIFWLLGLLLIVIGTYLLVNGTGVGDKPLKIFNYFVVGLGIFVFIIAFCGCFGAINESRVLLMIYMILLGIVIAIQVIVAIIVVVKKDSIIERLDEETKEIISTKYPADKGDNKYKESIDSIQKDNKCCGVQNYEDWKDTVWYKKRAMTNITYQEVPQSCCPPSYKNNIRACYNEQSYYKTGCKSVIESGIRSQMVLIGAILGGVILFELFVLLCAICLYNNVEHTI